MAVSQAEALERLIVEVSARKARGTTPVVVFDLDDTLFTTSHRNLRILKEFAGRPETRTAWVREAAALARLGPADLRYAIVDSAKAAGVEHSGLLEELRGFWFSRFFQNEYLLTDEPLPGAAEYCEAVAKAGARVVYLTGRDESMRDGTERSLARHAFPSAETTLILKPRFDTPDLAFKTEALARLPALGSVTGAFENEPLHVNLFHAAFPDALMYLLETKHSGKPVAPHPSALRLKDFRR